MYCPECGEEIEDTAKFCRFCRHRVAVMDSSSRVSQVTLSPLETASESASETPVLKDLPSRPKLSGQTVYPSLTEAGQVLSNRYELVSELGRGGMGQVWKAKDRHLGHFVALKLLPPEIAGNRRAAEAMKREAQLLLRLNHPNICRLMNYEEDRGICFLVMELVEGQTLEEVLDGKPERRMTLEEALPLFEQAAAGLDYAHNQDPPVLHRDIKPANIMVTASGAVKVLDFGIACELRETMTRMTGKSSAGTLVYMSPEQLEGEDPCKTWDVYSLAASLYEALSGRPPFHSGSIEHQIRNKEPKSLIAGGVTISRESESWILKGLAKKSEIRPANCVSLLGNVKSFMVPVSDDPPVPQVFCPDMSEKSFEELLQLITVKASEGQLDGLLPLIESALDFGRDHQGLRHLRNLLWEQKEDQFSLVFGIRIARLEIQTSINLASNHYVDDSSLVHLADLKYLAYLDLGGTRVTDKGLVHLLNIKELKGLYLRDTRITDAGLQVIKKMKGLVGLGLERNQITDAGLGHIKDLEELNWLNLNGTRVTRSGLVNLRGLKHLRHLMVNGTQISGLGPIHF